MIIRASSVFDRPFARILNSRPRIGMSPMPGIFCSVELIVLLISPAIANVWPFIRSTSVSVRRVLSAGIRNPLRRTPFAKSSVLTSGRTLRCTRSP